MISTTEHEQIIHNGLLLLLTQCYFEETLEFVIKENMIAAISSWAKYGSPNLSSIATQIYSLIVNKRVK